VLCGIGVYGAECAVGMLVGGVGGVGGLKGGKRCVGCGGDGAGPWGGRVGREVEG